MKGLNQIEQALKQYKFLNNRLPKYILLTKKFEALLYTDGSLEKALDIDEVIVIDNDRFYVMIVDRVLINGMAG